MNEKLLYLQDDLGVPKDVVTKQVQDALGQACVWGELSAEQAAQVNYIITVKSPVDESVLDRFPNLEAVAVAFTGYDAVDIPACQERGITVMNVPEYSTTAVAELVIGLTINVLREIPRATQVVTAGEWGFAPGAELAGKTVGIVGTGAIGQATAKLFRAFGCEVIAWSRTERDRFKDYGTYVAELSDLLAQADIVSLHVPHTPDTTGLIGTRELAQLQPSAILVNTARGPIIDEAALLAALDAGQLHAAALDVFTEEPLPVDHPLRSHERVLATPHISFNTVPALAERLRITVANLAAHAAGTSTNVVS